METDMALTIELKARFCKLAGDLSPENISCDGELPAKEVARRRRQIMLEWNALERKAGREVSEDETYRWYDEVRRFHATERAREMSAEGQHPKVRHANPGVWVREGKRDQWSFTKTAYYIWGPSHTGRDGYVVYSELGNYLPNRREEIGTFPSLDAAVEGGDAFLRSVTPDLIKARWPKWSDELVRERLNERLPENL